MPLDKELYNAAKEAIIERYQKKVDLGEGYIPLDYREPSYWTDIVNKAKAEVAPIQDELALKRLEMMRQITKPTPVYQYKPSKTIWVVKQYDTGEIAGTYSSETLAYDCVEALYSLYQIDCDVEEFELDLTVNDIIGVAE